MDDNLFPRGRPAVHPTSTNKKKTNYERNNDSLFTEKRKSLNQEESGKATKRKRKAEKAGPLKEHDEKDVKDLLENQEEIKVDFFHPKRVQEGTLLLGCIKEIHELELVVCLPHCNSGYVQANQISEIYTARIRQHLNDQLEDLVPLSQMFQVGDVVTCSVLNPNNSTSLQLTLYPSAVNKYLAIGDFYTGQTVTGTVRSEEDHGYSIDLGKNNMKAFLPVREACGRVLPEGTVVRTIVTAIRGEGSILLLSLDEKKIAKVSPRQDLDVSLDSLLPGTVGVFKTEQKVRAGIVGKFCGYNASICALDVDPGSKLGGNDHNKREGKKAKKGRKQPKLDGNSKPEETFFDKLMAEDFVKTCVLYVNPLTKHVALSSSPTLFSVQQRLTLIEDNYSMYPCGEKCEVFVDKFVKGLGAMLKLQNGTAAFCPPKHLSDKKFEDISEVFADQKSFPARVLQSITLDGPIVVTLKKSIVESEFHSFDKVEPGMKVTCTIKSVQDNGLVVVLGEKSFSPVKGFVPRIHMADVILQHPERRFSSGDIIECRVLSVNKVSRRIVLTHKKTLVKSKLPVVTNYDQLKPELLLHGYIASVKSYGVFVNFYNDVHGLVPKAQLSGSLDPLEDLNKTYFVGQVMKCRVLDCDAANARARLSFILKPRALSGHAKAATSTQLSSSNFTVEVIRKSEDGLEVLIHDAGKPRVLWEKAIIPIMHLSDFPSLASSFYERVDPGSLIPNCMIVSRRKGRLTLTRKKSIVDYHLDNEDGNAKNAIAFSDLKDGLICPGFIHNIVPYGVFVELPGGLVGLCPKSKMADKFLLTSDGYYQDNQSVIAKISEIDQDKKRFIVSLQESDCPELKQWDTMQKFAAEFEEIIKLLNISWQDGLGIGKPVEVKIQAVENGEVICKNAAFPPEFTAVLLDGEDSGAQKKHTATILYVDFKVKKIFLSMKAKPNKGTKLGKALKAAIAYINEDVALVTTKSPKLHALSLSRSHPNQSLFTDHLPWKVNDTVDVVMAKSINESNFVTSGTDGKASISPKRQRQESECSEASLQGETDFGNLEVGKEVEGVIKSVRNNGLLIQLSESEATSGYRGKPITGRLHISELEDKPQEGLFSLKQYHCWSKIKCKVIGFRDVRTQHFLAITKRNALRCVVDLSLRGEHQSLNFEDLDVGKEVSAFLTRLDPGKDEVLVEVNPSIKGVIPKLLLSGDLAKSSKLIGKCKKPVVWKCIVHKLNHNTAVFAGKGAMVDSMTWEDVTELKTNCVANAKVSKIFPSNLVLSLPDGGVGRVHICDFSDDFSENTFKDVEVGDFVRCAVLYCKDKKSLVLSMRKSRVEPRNEKERIKDEEITSAKGLRTGLIVRGFVKNISKFGVFVTLSRNVTGRVNLAKASKYYIHDPSVVKDIFKEGRLVTCKVIKISEMEGKVELSLLEEDTGVPEIIPEKLGLPLRHGKPHEEKKSKIGHLVDKVEGRKRKKRKQDKVVMKEEKSAAKKQRRDSDNRDSGLDEDFSLSDTSVGHLKNPSEYGMNEEDDPGFSWDGTPARQVKLDCDSDSDCTEQEEVNDVPKKTKKEKADDQAREEAELRRKEEMLLEDNLPETALDWDKLVLASPQNSLLWVSYMAFHLRSTEVEQARAVAERAIKTIDFREEKEKWNVWTALLNLENRFGTADTLTTLVERACRHNDPLKVNFHMVSTFERVGKFAEAEEICQKMVRKFRQNKTVWLLYITHLMQRGKREEAQEIFRRSLQSLEKKSHLEVISKFAQLEYKFGDAEHGRVLFENAVSSYPKRADIWSIYADMLIKGHKMEEAREVFERIVTLNLSTKKMRSFFKRFIEFETKFGSEDSVAEVKQKALEYINSKTSEMEE